MNRCSWYACIVRLLPGWTAPGGGNLLVPDGHSWRALLNDPLEPAEHSTLKKSEHHTNPTCRARGRQLPSALAKRCRMSSLPGSRTVLPRSSKAFVCCWRRQFENWATQPAVRR